MCHYQQFLFYLWLVTKCWLVTKTLNFKTHIFEFKSLRKLSFENYPFIHMKNLLQFYDGNLSGNLQTNMKCVKIGII